MHRADAGSYCCCSASTGTITRAAIDPTRTIAVITGSVTSPPGSTVVIDERPSLPSYTCKVDDWKSSDPNIKRVISGITDGFFSFDRSIALLAPGMVDLRLCITVVQQFDEQDPVCVAQAPDPATCPLISRIVSEVVATTLFTVQPQPTFTPPSGVPPHETPVIPVPSVLPVPKLTASQAKAAANSYFKHHYRSFRRGSKRSITTRKVTSLSVQPPLSGRTSTSVTASERPSRRPALRSESRAKRRAALGSASHQETPGEGGFSDLPPPAPGRRRVRRRRASPAASADAGAPRRRGERAR